MTKTRLFIENFLVYGLGGIISRIIPFIMIPIVTRLMPNSEYYGISDMSNTVVSFLGSIAVLGMYDAMFRLFFDCDDENYKKKVCSSALVLTSISSALVFIMVIIMRNSIALFFYNNNKYNYLVDLAAFATLVGATNSIISAPTRMQNNKKIFLVTNTISPLISYGLAVIFLLKGYYIIALPLAGVISSVVMEISFGVINRRWFSIKYFDKKFIRPLAEIAIPLFPNFIVYWIFNSCDRVMITKILGISYSGLYAVGSKLGLASQLIYVAFAGGWQYFAFSTMNEKNQIENNSRIFEYLGCISFISLMFVCSFAKKIYEILFPEEYSETYIISIYLFLAPLLLMLYQVAANQFIIIKKTWPNMFILAIGAVANIALNTVLIPRIGIEGAAISTLLGYCISLIICIGVLIYYKLFVMEKRFLFISLVSILLLILWRNIMVKGGIIMFMIAVVFILFCFLLYRNELLEVIKKLKEKRSNM